MLKKNKWILLATSVVILLPVLAGRILWDQLPEQMATHWGASNEPNGWSGKAFTVFGLPGLMLVLHWFVIVMTSIDPKRKNISEKLFSVLVWIIPATSLVTNAAVYAYAMGMQWDIGLVALLLVGAVSIVLGNYLPKCEQNYTVGIRTPWTLDDPENWQRTHRVAGWAMTICGVLTILSTFFGGWWLALAVILAAAVAPYLYSYVFYRKHSKGKDDT